MDSNQGPPGYEPDEPKSPAQSAGAQDRLPTLLADLMLADPMPA